MIMKNNKKTLKFSSISFNIRHTIIVLLSRCPNKQFQGIEYALQFLIFFPYRELNVSCEFLSFDNYRFNEKSWNLLFLIQTVQTVSYISEENPLSFFLFHPRRVWFKKKSVPHIMCISAICRTVSNSVRTDHKLIPFGHLDASMVVLISGSIKYISDKHNSNNCSNNNV